MVDKICKIKNELLDKIDKEISERGLDRIDAHNLGETVDMVKDLAVAEEKCRKAEYYRLVCEQMDGGPDKHAPHERPEAHDEAASAIERIMGGLSRQDREDFVKELSKWV